MKMALTFPLGISVERKSVVKKIRLASAVVGAFLMATAMPARAVEVGQKAPDFELASTHGGKLKLSSLQGKKNVLIEFYVLDFTPT